MKQLEWKAVKYEVGCREYLVAHASAKLKFHIEGDEVEYCAIMFFDNEEYDSKYYKVKAAAKRWCQRQYEKWCQEQAATLRNAGWKVEEPK